MRFELSEIMTDFEELYKLDLWEEADEMITFYNTQTTRVDCLICILTMTGSNMVGIREWKNRSKFLEEVRQRLIQENRDVTNILRGLE